VNVCNGTRSVRGTAAIAMTLCNTVRVWYWSSSYLVPKRGSCVVLEEWMCGNGSRSVRGTGVVVEK
jgi:hypothetical protein